MEERDCFAFAIAMGESMALVMYAYCVVMEEVSAGRGSAEAACASFRFSSDAYCTRLDSVNE